MAREDVELAVRALEKALNEGEHNCEIVIEDLGEIKEVAYFVDESAEDGNPITMTVVPLQG